MNKEKIKIDIDRLKRIYNATNYEELSEKLNISKSAIDGWIRNKRIPSKYMIKIENSREFKEISERETIINGICENVKLMNDLDLYKTLIFTSDRIRESYINKIKEEKETIKELEKDGFL